MRIAISHETHYTFSEPVHLDPHTLRLRPREDYRQRLISYRRVITPDPAGSNEGIGPEGSPFALAWFEGRFDALTIAVEAVVETKPVNPFDFLFVPPEAARLGFSHPDHTAAALHAALGRNAPDGYTGTAIEDLARRQAEQVGFQTMGFLTGLAARIQSEFAREERPEGPPRDAVETLQLGRGSCRDLTVLFIDTCRAAGLAARFVSGYHLALDPRSPDDHELHAWAEVYLPGAGWRGFDPTTGLVCTDGYVALASAADPRDAMPVSGSFRGDARARLDVRVRIEAAR